MRLTILFTQGEVTYKYILMYLYIKVIICTFWKKISWEGVKNLKKKLDH